MEKTQREDIYILTKHSDISEKELDSLLTDTVYMPKNAWEKFLQLFFITLGVGFTTAGIIFFFAYNWQDLNKFFKIGIIETLILATTSLVLFLKVNPMVRNILLTASAVLVGVLFAVFGQIYQTGANAFDFFTAWTLLITIWVVVSNFPPLWLIYIVLINTSFVLYTEQVVSYWSEIDAFTMLFLLNATPVVVSLLITKLISNIKIPYWFYNVITLFALYFATVGMVIGIFDEMKFHFPLLVAFVIILFGAGLFYGVKFKSGFFISSICFASIIIINALIINASSKDEAMFLMCGIFTIASITGVILYLISLQKTWSHESEK